MLYTSIIVKEFSPTTTIEIPDLCPHCGVANNPSSTQIGHSISAENIDGAITSFLHYCQRCHQYHYTIQQQSSNSAFSCVMSYPKGVSPDIDPLLKTQAPNFVKYYSESIEAEYNGLTNLAAMGLRAAIESLIKDYASALEMDSKDKIAKTSFNDAIKTYIEDDDLLSGVAHLIRKVGNNYAHWENTTDIQYATMRSYTEIIIKSFQQKFMMKHLPNV